MGRGRKGGGVEIRSRSIRLRFTWQGKRCNETLALAPTPPNLKYAHRLIQDVRRAIERGSFDYAEYFPNSPRASQSARRIVTLAEIGRQWLRSKGRLASATRSQYRNALAFWYAQLGGEDRDIRQITHGLVAAVVGAHDWPSAKLCNNYLIPLRGLFALAIRDRHIVDDPTLGIENMPLQSPLPDPFTMDEANAIVGDMAAHYDERIVNYFEFAFCSGLRPEEQIALTWTDIDWQAGSARVQRAKSFRGEVRPVKGYKARDVELSARALTVLKRQKAHTFMKAHGFIFENPVTDRPFHDERSQRDHYWTPALKRLGLRYRRPYCTRHTYATTLIMSDCNIKWLAKQMGNSPRVIDKHYTTWIERVDQGRQRERMDQAFGTAVEFGPNLAPNVEITGRRDWTRTNDPHHVKVVL
jgi:integrase